MDEKGEKAAATPPLVAADESLLERIRAIVKEELERALDRLEARLKAEVVKEVMERLGPDAETLPA